MTFIHWLTLLNVVLAAFATNLPAVLGWAVAFMYIPFKAEKNEN